MALMHEAIDCGSCVDWGASAFLMELSLRSRVHLMRQCCAAQGNLRHAAVPASRSAGLILQGARHEAPKQMPVPVLCCREQAATAQRCGR